MTLDDISWTALVQTFSDELWNKTELISFLTFIFIVWEVKGFSLPLPFVKLRSIKGQKNPWYDLVAVQSSSEKVHARRAPETITSRIIESIMRDIILTGAHRS